jgi:hypothetical protein
MVLALGSISLFRTNQIALHPFGFFTAALQSISPIGFSFGAIEDIENFLLISHFGVFYHIGCSIWELSQLSMRMCVELGLHRQVRKRMDGLNLEGERGLRVFWSCYAIDRLASFTLGRPPSLEESDINVDLPSDGNRPISSEDNGTAQALREEAHNEVVVFNHMIRLARISSRINEEVVSLPKAGFIDQQDERVASDNNCRPLNPAAVLFPLVKKFDKELYMWFQEAPRYESPSCVYQMAEKFELEYQIARFLLLRASIDRISHVDSGPPSTLLRPCIDAAIRIIHQYDYLRARELMTYTRRFTHLVLSAGLILLSAAFSGSQAAPSNTTNPTSVDCESWWVLEGDNHNASLSELLSVLETTGTILSWFSKHMPDMSVYSHFFEALRRQLLSMPRLHSSDSEPGGISCRSATDRLWSGGQQTGLDVAAAEAGENNGSAVATGALATTAVCVNDRDSGSGFEALESNFVTQTDTTGVHGWSDFAPPISRGLWSFPSGFQDIEDVELGLSGLDWDANIPWNTPSATEAELDALLGSA